MFNGNAAFCRTCWPSIRARLALVALASIFAISIRCSAQSIEPQDSSATSQSQKSTRAAAAIRVPADRPERRGDANSQLAHEQLLEKARRGGIDVYFVGDSITRRWGCSDPQYADLLANWQSNFFGWNAANFGWGGDTTQNILWRLNHGELDGVHPKVIVVLAGTNNLNAQAIDDDSAEEIARGIAAIVKACREKAPAATIIVTAIFPRSDKPSLKPTINQINDRLAMLADQPRIRFLNVNAQLTNDHGELLPGMLPDGLHPGVPGYQVWADGLRPILSELLGPPAKSDRAPPPTGDPSAQPKTK